MAELAAAADTPKPAAPSGEGDASPSPEAAPPRPPLLRGDPAWLPLVVAVAAPVLFFFILPPLTKAGLWDPFELNIADLARRIALNLHGAESLALEGADNSLPHLNDLGRPQAPFTSIALGFKAFGLVEWAGRAPLALWGLIGVLTTYGFVARLVDRRAGAFAALVLTSMPLYFVQARTMLGDVVTMSAFAMAFGGLTVAIFDEGDEGEGRVRGRAAWLVVGVMGLLVGFFARGGILGVGAPALAVAIAWAIVVLDGRRSFDVLARVTGAAALVVGAYATLRGGAGLEAVPRASDLDPWVGAMFRGPAQYPTFDYFVGHVAAALVPWSAFAPFAFGRLFVPPRAATPTAEDREVCLRTALFVGAAVAFGAHAWMAPRVELIAFVAPAVVAAACGVALRDYERGAHASLAVGVGTLLLLGVFHHELHKLPEKAFNAFAVVQTTFPESFKAQALTLWWVVLGGFAVLAVLTFVERDADREPFDPRRYLPTVLALRDAWDGMLALTYFALVASGSLAGLAVWIGTRTHAKWMPALSGTMRAVVVNLWWVAAFGPILVVFGALFACDVWLWTFERARPFGRGSFSRGFEPFEELAARLKSGKLGERVPKLLMGKLVVTPEEPEDGVAPTALFLLVPLMYFAVPGAVFAALVMTGTRWMVALAFSIPSGVLLFLVLGALGDLLRGSRAAAFVLGGAVLGGVLCFSYYPALANQLSPKEVFDVYRRVHAANEPLALLGVGGRTAAYYAGAQPTMLRDTGSAYTWLNGGEGGRRFLAARAEELSRLNRAHREQTNGAENIAVLDARSSQILLVASSLRPGEKNENPLDEIVSTTEPTPRRKLDVTLEDKLQVLGYDVFDAHGRSVDVVSPGKKYHMKTYFKVLAPVTTEWEMFIHIDGYQRRHNGDHKLCGGKYPMSLWLPGDILTDDYEFSLEPNFTAGAYAVYFGLFLGETRMKIGKDGDNRVNGGTLRVQ